jgi:hypothetical protein
MLHACNRYISALYMYTHILWLIVLKTEIYVSCMIPVQSPNSV